jgi:hypothetical protein
VRLANMSVFKLKRKSFFSTIYQTDNDAKKLKKKTFRACLVSMSIRNFVSEFVCHPVLYLLIKYCKQIIVTDS